jgi:hypothetical protein
LRECGLHPQRFAHEDEQPPLLPGPGSRRDYGSPALLHVNPAAVVAVVESERQRGGLPLPVAVLTLNTGHEYTVEDGARRVAKEIREARLQESRS